MAWRWPWSPPTVPSGTDATALTLADPELISLMLGYTPGQLGAVTERTAMTLSAVFRAVSLVSGAIGSLPLRTLKTDAEGTRTRASSFLDNPGLDRWTPFEWKELTAVYLLLHGAAYLQHVYAGGGQLVGLNPIHPAAVEVCEADVPSGREFKVRLDDGDTRTFDARTMTCIMGISLDGVRGLSPITAARLSLGTGLAGDKASARMFSNGAMISGLVTPDEDLTEPEAKIVKETVNRSLTGVENAGDIAVINRKLKFTPWTMNAVDAQFIQSRSFSIDEVGRWFGVPPHLLGLTEKATSWGQGIAEQNRGLARYTLMPWTSRIEQRLSRLVKGSTIAEFDYAQFIAPSPETEINLLLSQVAGGLITPNEARRVRNLPALPGKENDQLRVPRGTQALPVPEPAKAPGPAPAPAPPAPKAPKEGA